MYEAVVLAAGYASRAGTNKLSLQLNGLSLIESLIRVLDTYCNRIVVVTGHYHEELQALLSHVQSVHIVYNADYSKGMFSSILTGVQQTTKDCFIVPGDYPLIQTKTIEALMASSGLISVPTFEGRRGHPILIRAQLVDLLKQEPIDSHLRAFRDRYEVDYVPVLDPYILVDIDTIDDYDNLKNRVDQERKVQ